MEETDIKILLTAIKDLNVDQVVSILKTGIDVNNHGGNLFNNPLYHGVLVCHKDIIQSLLNFGARPEGIVWIKFSEILRRRKHRLSPDIMEIFEILVDSGIDLNFPLENGETLLMDAASNGAIELVKKLVSSGADVNKVNRKNEFALLKAARSNSSKVYSYLYDFTSKALREIAQNYIEENKLLEKFEISDIEKDIISCIQIDDLSFFKCYVGDEVNLNFFDQYGDTPLCIISMVGNPELTDFLIKAGADVNLGNKITGHTPLLYASGYLAQAVQLGDAKYETRYLDVIKLLINSGADVNRVDKDGFSPLMGAVNSRSYQAVEYLIKAGANVNEKDKDSRDALFYADDPENAQIIQLLIQAQSF